MTFINAQEAKEIAREGQHTLEEVMKHIDDQIRRAAARGEMLVRQPFDGLQKPVAMDVKVKVIDFLRKQGYIVSGGGITPNSSFTGAEPMSFDQWLSRARPDGVDDAIRALPRNCWDHQQARIDELMLKHCPGEMTPDQLSDRSQSQAPANPRSVSAFERERKAEADMERFAALCRPMGPWTPKEPEPGFVKLPQSEAEARAMVAVGTAYLNQHH